MTNEEQIKYPKEQLAAATGGEQKGKATILLEKIFGRNWRTSISGLLAFLSGSSGLILDWLSQTGVSAKILKGVAMVFGLIAIINAKDKAVTGVNVIPSTGTAGPTETKLAVESAHASPYDPTKQVINQPQYVNPVMPPDKKEVK